MKLLCAYVPVVVLRLSESHLMHESSCYCDSLSHSRSGLTISAQPAALSQPLPNMHTHTHRRSSVREPLPQSCWGDKEELGACVWESPSVCVGWEGVQWICPFQFAFLSPHWRLCKETDLLLQLAVARVQLQDGSPYDNVTLFKLNGFPSESFHKTKNLGNWPPYSLKGIRVLMRKFRINPWSDGI